VGRRLVIRFDCVTIFPEMFAAVTQNVRITRRALEEKRWACCKAWNPRDFAGNAWGRVDDRPFGGGPGMVMQPGPLEKAIAAAQGADSVRQGLAKEPGHLPDAAGRAADASKG
jgi:tRNA (guanine37-N1)-methyltransferase